MIPTLMCSCRRSYGLGDKFKHSLWKLGLADLEQTALEIQVRQTQKYSGST